MPTTFWTSIESLDGADAYNVHRADLEPFFEQLTRDGVLPLADLDAAFGKYGPAVAALLAQCPGVKMAEGGRGMTR